MKSYKEELDRSRTMIESIIIIDPMSQGVWILNSGTIDHMPPFPKLFNSYVKMARKQLITVANGDNIPI